MESWEGGVERYTAVEELLQLRHYFLATKHSKQTTSTTTTPQPSAATATRSGTAAAAAGMPTCVSAVWAMLVEAEQAQLSRVQATNDRIREENEQLQEQIHDLRFHLQMKREAEGRRMRWLMSRHSHRLQGRMYHS
ncbi:hypothetical protein Pcinc_036226 [Petrolisthes cinctipes]|uniref:Uncharacterized protein n=1 Tax=Petrolisthes cinctipes TaxID=88211 RepID=A0AAE1EM73_PETCI|nr:hypothetical protein Pcinc_036226 [Petrolisthes cinctipes]